MGSPNLSPALRARRAGQRAHLRGPPPDNEVSSAALVGAGGAQPQQIYTSCIRDNRHGVGLPPTAVTMRLLGRGGGGRVPPGMGLAPTLLVYKYFADELMGCIQTPPHAASPGDGVLEAPCDDGDGGHWDARDLFPSVVVRMGKGLDLGPSLAGKEL